MKYEKKNYKNVLVHGIGITDIPEKINNITQPYYTRWHCMLIRCYYIKEQETRNISYIGCSVCEEWHLLSTFKKWYDINYIDGYVLDKDILIDGNKVYSPETCCFIPQHLNKLFNDRARSRGKYKLGVSLHKKTRKFASTIRCYNKAIHLGLFNNEIDAHNAWLKTKRDYARKLAIDAYMNNEIDERIMNAIIIKAYNLK